MNILFLDGDPHFAKGQRSTLSGVAITICVHHVRLLFDWCGHRLFPHADTYSFNLNDNGDNLLLFLGYYLFPKRGCALIPIYGDKQNNGPSAAYSHFRLVKSAYFCTGTR